MPPQQPYPSFWQRCNQVTWYSKLGAIFLFLGAIPALCFYIGMQYQLTLDTIPSPEISNQPSVPQTPVSGDYKDTTYTIESQKVTLKNGVSEVEAAPGSASKITTRYFGDDLKTDLNGDGIPDLVFLLTQNGGGSGTFFYVVGAVQQKDGSYLGSDGYPIGDRIAPQNITESQNPNQKNVIVVNYADRKAGEPMVAQPSVGKSVYLKLDPSTMQWGVVQPNFEGESR